MNTQNVNVKTATKESTERWVENLLAMITSWGREWLTGTRTFCRCISALLNRGFSPGNSLSFFMVMLVRMRGMTHANTLLTQCALNPICHESAFFTQHLAVQGPPVIHIRRDV